MSQAAVIKDGLLDGHEVARAVRAEILEMLAALHSSGLSPELAVVLLSDDAASRAYAESKRRACTEMGLRCTLHDLSGHAADVAGIARRIREIAEDPRVHGLMVEQPLPPGVDPMVLYACIPAEKDVEGVGYASLGRLMLGRPTLVAATPAAVMRILDHYGVPLAGRRAVVVGRSDIVGKPLAALLLARDATVVVCHSRTPDLASETIRADVLVAAAGRPRLIGVDHVRPGAVVVDVGINFEDGHMVGDVDVAALRGRAAAVTPVPGGVGPVTTAMLLWNLVHTAVLAQRTRSGPRSPEFEQTF